MARDPEDLPACYALVLPGLEPVAADEITRDLAGQVRRSERGLVVFRTPRLDPSLLKIRTAEDLFLMAWGTDELTFRATDLKSIKHWTLKEANWPELLLDHQRITERTKGKLTYRVVTQMMGDRGYRRVDAGMAVREALEAKMPSVWKPVADDATVEIWLTILGKAAVCGVRLSDRDMRHRTYKSEHLPASLRPTVAAAMVRLGGASPGETVLDPMCGAGTVLAEQILLSKQRKAGFITTLGGDIDPNALAAATTNLRKVGPTLLARWDSRRLPLGDESVERIVCNPPFGKQLSTPEEIVPLYVSASREWNRVLKPGGRAVLLVSDAAVLEDALKPWGWQASRKYKVEILGNGAAISVWNKPGELVKASTDYTDYTDFRKTD